jgi:ATP-binding cassette subfamily F protein 3
VRVLARGRVDERAPGQKVGLVGPNGSGKSSLFALIRDELHADAGEVSIPPRWVLSHVAQETPAVERPALEFVMDGDVELREIEAAIATAEASTTPAITWRSCSRYRRDRRLPGALRARRPLLAGLGFDEDAQARSVATFSAAGACASTSRARSCAAPTCCSWTSPPTTWTSTR